jgi:chorismate dehydratase
VPTVGIVPYLNAAPLVADLPPHVKTVAAVPSTLSAWLAEGTVDAALLPVAEAIRGVGDGWIGRHGIACDGPVKSVLLFLPPPAVADDPATWPGRVILDPASRTSAALLRAVMAGRHGLSPAYETAPAPGPDPRARADAATLVIGDAALAHARTWTGSVLDLGAQWKVWTGLPFVFARWTARAGLPAPDRAALAATLDEAARRGLARRPAIAAERGPRHGLSAAEALSYMTDSLRYEIDARAEAGLARFAQALSRETPGRARPHAGTAARAHDRGEG